MTPGLVIFDLDGVLVDSEPIVNRAAAEVLTMSGFPIGEAELLERFCGVSDRDMVAALEREWGRALPADYAERLAARVEQDYRAQLRAIAGVDRLLDSVASPVCIASSGDPERIRLALDCAGLRHRFSDRFSATMVTRGKPAPDIFLYAAARMGVPPGRCVVVEDSLAGIEAATAAGMTQSAFAAAATVRKAMPIACAREARTRSL
jgi:HAD superfamily hydrolase (TIGR01509 family)